MMITNKPENLWSKDYILILFATLGINFCNYFFYATLPIYAQKLTGTVAYAGLMTTIYTFGAFAIRPFSGFLSDKIGRTKLLILGAALCAIACGLYNFAEVFIVLVLLRVLQGIGFGMHSTLGSALAVDIIPSTRRAEAISYIAVFSTIAVALAPGIALSIIGDGAAANFRLLFTLAAVVALMSMIFDCFVSCENKHKNDTRDLSHGEDPIKSNLPKTLLGFEYAVFLPALVTVLLYVALSSVTSFIFLFAMDRSLGNIGLFFTVNAAGTFLSRLFLGRVADKRGANIIIIPGIISLALCFALIPLVNAPLYLLAIAFPFGLAQGAVGPLINTMMFNRCSAQRRGAASAAFFASIDIGYGLGSVIFGVIAAAYNYYLVYWGAMICCLIALVIFCLGIAPGTKPINY